MTLGRALIVAILLAPIGIAYFFMGQAIAVCVSAFTIPAILIIAKRW